MLTSDRFYRSSKDWEDPDQIMANKYGKFDVDDKTGKLMCDISLKFPNPEHFFNTQTLAWLERDVIRNRKSNELLRIGWTRTEQGQVFYRTTLASGQIPESDDAFMWELVSDMELEWSLILNNAEERFSESISPF